MIIQTVGSSEFIAAFLDIRPDNFSNQALDALFEHLEELSESLEEPLELDVIAICCDVSEYASIEVAKNNYGSMVDDLEDLKNHTTVIELPDGGLVIQDF